MTLKTLSKGDAAKAVPARLHYCQFDYDWTPRKANYPLPQPLSTDRVANICSAYNVTPHPDMPAGVHNRMDQRLRCAVGAAGYYYCLTQAGDPFWISLSLYPTSTGVLVCHFEVTSPELSHLALLFTHLSRAEQSGMDEDECAAQLLTFMAQENAPDYRAIATTIMMDEMEGRQIGPPRKQFTQLRLLLVMLGTLREIDSYGKEIAIISERSRLIPFQLKLQAARLEGGRGPVSVIAGNHQSLTDQLLAITGSIKDASANEIEKLTDALAYLAQSNHVAELIEHDTDEQPDQARMDADLLGCLHEVMDDCALRVSEVLSDIDNSVANLISISHRMRRALTAMEMTRLMCKIERAKVEGPAEGLGNIIEQLQKVERSLSEAMSHIDQSSKTAQDLVDKVSKSRASKAA